MKVWQDPEEWFKERQKTALTIGNFDGVHRGHQELLRRTVKAAEQKGLFSLLITFHPHPITVLAPDKKHTRLFDLQDQQEQLAKTGLQGLLRQPFSRQFSEMSATVFLEDYLLKYFQPQVIVVGHDFSFGAHRSGTFELLQVFGDKHKIAIERVPPLEIDQTRASTSKIRECLLSGNLQLAEKLLGRKYYLKGIVEKGEGRGRTLGFPTANIKPDVDFYPKMGVYVCKVSYLNRPPMTAVMNVGLNRTFVEGDHHPIKAEVHLLDFSEDLYGRTLKVELVEYLREEKKFSGLDELKAQIARDIEKARQVR